MVPGWRWEQAVVEWSARCVLPTIDLGGCLITNRFSSIYADAMQTFAQADDKWFKTWPESEEDRAMRMYVVSTLTTVFENFADGATL